MVEIADIKDRITLKAWLEARPEATRYAISVAIANRAAMRVLPRWAWYFDGKKAKVRSPNYVLALFRCALTSAVAPVSPTTDVKLAAASAGPTARAITPAIAGTATTSDAAFATVIAAATVATTSDAAFATSIANGAVN